MLASADRLGRTPRAVMRQAPIPVEGGQLSRDGCLTMADTIAWRIGLSSDRGMKDAPVKSEPEVIADPKGTAVNEAMLPQSPHTPVLRGRTNRTQSLDVVSTHTQGDWRWRAERRCSASCGTRGLYVNTAAGKCDHSRTGRVAITVRTACGRSTSMTCPETV